MTGIITVALMFGTLSCTDLEEFNPTGTTAETIWSTPQGFQTLINAAYSNQRTVYGKEDGIVMGEAGTDIWFKANKGTSYRQLFRYLDFSGVQSSSTRNYWRDLWPGVNFCNACIARVDDAGYPSLELKNSKVAECHFLRAFYYWHIVETWGNVYLRKDETTNVEFTAQRTPIEDFYELMISDLEFAVEWLPATPVNPDEYSRATKKSAMGMLARVLLTRAYYSLDKGNQAEADDYFARAKNMAHAAIDSCVNKWGISLYPSYADLWKNGPGGNNKNNKETMYAISNSSNFALNYDNNGNRLHLWFMCNYNDKPGLQGSMEYGFNKQRLFMPTQFLLDLFDESMDSRYAASFQETWICNVSNGYVWTEGDAQKFGKHSSVIGDTVHPGDTALLVTKKIVPDKRTRNYVVFDRDSLFLNDTIRTNTDVYNPMIKHLDPNRASSSAQPGYLDILVIRLAEMYLIAAEAEVQLGERNLAADDINVIRQRAALPGKENDMRISADDVDLDFILDERARELAGEHLRWFDLKRTRKLVERIEKYNKDIKIPDILMRKDNGYFENVLLRPIPQVELDALENAEEFGQNPGYN